MTLEIITTKTDLGSDAIIKKPAYINLDCIFKDASGKILLRYSIEHAGGHYDHELDAGSRMAECYGRAAEMLLAHHLSELRQLN